jgi:hypothetical protein
MEIPENFEYPHRIKCVKLCGVGIFECLGSLLTLRLNFVSSTAVYESEHVITHMIKIDGLTGSVKRAHDDSSLVVLTVFLISAVPNQK